LIGLKVVLTIAIGSNTSPTLVVA